MTETVKLITKEELENRVSVLTMLMQHTDTEWILRKLANLRQWEQKSLDEFDKEQAHLLNLVFLLEHGYKITERDCYGSYDDSWVEYYIDDVLVCDSNFNSKSKYNAMFRDMPSLNFNYYIDEIDLEDSDMSEYKLRKHE